MDRAAAVRVEDAPRRPSSTGLRPARPSRRESAVALSVTDTAIEKLREVVATGEYGPGDKLPNEGVLCERLGLSRGSLREAVSALRLMGVLDVRQGAGTYVSSLEPGLIFESARFSADLMRDRDVLEAYQLRRLLEPEAIAAAAGRLSDDDLDAIGAQIERMAAATTAEALVDLDLEFHDMVIGACGNALIAAVLRAVSGRTSSTRIWRGITEEGALAHANAGHGAIFEALKAGDARRAHAAAYLHIADGEDWLKHLIASGADPDSGNMDAASRR
jgi:DNA-binding FadR family transcriptional regulator